MSSSRQSALLLLSLLFTLLLLLQQSSSSSCPPSSCGKISNISHPFRLRDDPKHCGKKKYELSCEDGVAVANLYSGKYHVVAINYNNFTIRLADPGVQDGSNCSSFPTYFLSRSNFTDTYNYSYLYGSGDDPYRGTLATDPDGPRTLAFEHIVYMNCTHPVKDPAYVDTDTCINWNSNSNSKGYIYAIIGDLLVETFKVGCHVKLVTPITPSWWRAIFPNNNISYTFIHRVLVYGFEVSWFHPEFCDDQCEPGPFRDYCNFDYTNELFQCPGRCRDSWFIHRHYVCGTWPKVRIYVTATIKGIFMGLLKLLRASGFKGDHGIYGLGIFIGYFGIPSFVGARYLFGVTLFIAFLIHKWRRRHLSMYAHIEIYLQENNLMPIRYSSREIKKMAKGFKDKLGEGGFGSVFKGKLRSGPDVAIKMLGKKSKTNGQDFINEVATIGRIHHVNVVKLIGFCAEGSKRALVYEFMQNGSLDKYIFPKEGSVPLSYDKIYDISLQIARGIIAYLHQGCEMQILHFDIKPHNILLDENFTPKISDFGLAKLYPIENSIVTMTAARGTIGYMAPELFYQNIGGVSYKADVYSFGMLLMEMAGRRKNLNPHAEHSSQLYFPLWIYDQLDKDKETEIEDVAEEEMKMRKKMVIVALWCIQLKPRDRPSMSKVVEMLEGEVESLEMPPKPSLYPQETYAEDQAINSSQTFSDLSSSASTSDPVEVTTTGLEIENAT